MSAATPQRVSSFGAFGRYLAAMIAHIREAGPLRVGLRALVIWVLDVVALVVMVALLPGLNADSLGVVVIAALVIGLLNAVVRPLVLALAINLPIIVFAIVVFLLNAVMIWLVGWLVPGFQVSGLLPALVASF